MDLQIKHKYEDEDIFVPDVIHVRGYSMPVTSKKSDLRTAELQLWNDGVKLGALLYSVERGSIVIDHLYAEDMMGVEGEPKLFKSALRNSKRVPVGTILIGAIKKIAEENNIKILKTIPLPNSKNFYRKMGFNNRGILQTRNRNRNRSRSRSRNRTRRN